MSRAIPPMGDGPVRDRVTVAGATPATMTPAELRREIVAEGRTWRHCMGRLKAADAWFRAAGPDDPDRHAAVTHARELTGAAFRARLAGGNALLSYVAKVTAMDAAARAFEADILGLDPTDAATIWLVYFPCPIACSALAFEMLGWSPWWDISLGEPPACADCEQVCIALIPADRADRTEASAAADAERTLGAGSDSDSGDSTERSVP